MGEFVDRAKARLEASERELEDELAGKCNPDRIAALNAIIRKREQYLESCIRAEFVIPPR